MLQVISVMENTSRLPTENRKVKYDECNKRTNYLNVTFDVQLCVVSQAGDKVA